MKHYTFSDTAILRTPLRKKQTHFTWEEIQAIFKTPKYREALFLGSPNLYQALTLWEKGEGFQKEEELNNLKGSLYKYASRLSNRPTPFGLFATVSTVKMGKETHLPIQENQLKRHTKFDMFFLGRLVPIFLNDSSIRQALVFYPNNTLYKISNKFRYVEYYFKKEVRFHKISEVELTDYLNQVVNKAKEGATINQLLDLLISDQISKQDAFGFVNTLINSQFLVSELEFTVTGPDYFDYLIGIFKQERFDFHEAKVALNLINELKQSIKKIDQDVFNSPEDYLKIHQRLEKELDEIDLTKLFQVDTFRKIENATLSFKTLKSLRTGVSVVNKFYGKRTNSTLQTFKQKFAERYEEYEMPLVEVLDPDISIGYGSHSGAKTPLVDQLPIRGNSSSERSINLTTKQAFLFRELIKATAQNKKEIQLTDQQVNQFSENHLNYPDSFSVFFNQFNENDQEKIHIKTVTGPSANCLIGRFSHLDESIGELCDQITDHENQLNSDKIIAEIVHLPQARTGNILYRHFQRDYEIPYLGNSSLPKENQIDINDLYVSVKYNRVVLRSKKLNKEIIPRLSNAHNYRSNALPIYHFLSDLQNQDSYGFGFSWGGYQQDFEFLPRLSYKNIILSKATWNLHKNTIDKLLEVKEQAVVKVVRDFKKTNQLPDVVCFTQGDNEVVINFNSELSCKVFHTMLKGLRFVQLTEFLFAQGASTQDYCNEWLVTALKSSAETSKAHSKLLATESKSKFSIGDKWLYYKFYCGERAAEELLSGAILPIVTKLKQQNWIDKWFFIRYFDASGSHLRFRVLVSDQAPRDQIIALIKTYITPFESSNIIWKTQTDTYLRELQRYGDQGIECAESLFYNDSQATLEFIDMIEGDLGEQIRWKFALLSMHYFVNDFDLTLKEKIEVFKLLKTNYGKEFNRKDALNKKINSLYNENEKSIDQFLDFSKTDPMFHPIWEVLERRSKQNKAPIEQLKQLAKEEKLSISIENLIYSYLHMICNRIFLGKQRIHEMVVNDFMYKYYSKQWHTQKKQVKQLEVEGQKM